MKPVVAIAAVLILAVSAMAAPEPVVLAELLDNPPESPVRCLHRGGVITPEAPECSLRALRLAGEMGFEMIELDIRESKDGVPVIFHDNTMMDDTGKPGRAEDYTAAELAEIMFSGSDQKIPTLAEALAIHKEYGMGLMLDIKTDGSDEYYQTIRQLILENGLEQSTVCIARYEKAQKHLSDVSLMRMSKAEFDAVERGDEVDLANKFWFGHADHIGDEMVSKIHERGALVFPSINIFHYPEDRHLEIAERDIKRFISLGVITFQVDSVHAGFFE